MTMPARPEISGFVDNPGYRVDLEPCPRRVRAVFNGETLVDTTRARLLLESNHVPVYYFPRDDLRLDLLQRTDHHTFCPYKGHASYRTLRVGDRNAENAVWSYEDPFDEVAEIKDYVAFYWDVIDHWYNEDDEIFGHAHHPYHRVDVVNSSRPVKVVLGGETVAETTRARFLFETALPTRYYIPPEDVRTDLLAPTETGSICPYKGTARYWSMTVGDKTFEDVVWSYPDPISECPKIKGHLCFFNERVDDIFVDDTPVEKVKTKWSRK